MGARKAEPKPYEEHLPGERLAPFVTCFWEVTPGEVASGPRRVLPDGAMDVLYVLGSGGARIIGPMTRAIVTPGRATVVGVRFRPGAAPSLLGLAARELLDDAAPARDVWGAGGRALDARLAGASSARSVMRILEGELEARAAKAPAPDRRVSGAVGVLRAAGGELPIPAVAARVGLSERQMERLFHERVGYGPKLFARIVRLERSTRAIEGGRGSLASWASLAAQCGYADQAHLIREFRALTGVTPAAFAAARGPVSENDNTGRGSPGTVTA
jgi:AraC-like DNA-binding protein